MNDLVYEIKFHNLWKSTNPLDKPEECIEKLPNELYIQYFLQNIWS